MFKYHVLLKKFQCTIAKNKKPINHKFKNIKRQILIKMKKGLLDLS